MVRQTAGQYRSDDEFRSRSRRQAPDRTDAGGGSGGGRNTKSRSTDSELLRRSRAARGGGEMSLTAGTRLGPYEILATLGAGGMGVVYRAREPRLGREVAIKVSAERFSDRFEREVRAVAALNHANICQVYDVGLNYLVMEVVEGPTLADRIKEGALPLE